MLNSTLVPLWIYRHFILGSIRNEFASRFARSRMGGLWMVVQPLVQVAIFAIVLSNVLAARLPGINDPNGYALYLMAGTLIWSLFNEIVTRFLRVFIDHGNLLKKVSFPRMTLPAIVVGSCLLNSILLFASVLAIFALLGHMPGAQSLWVPVLACVVILLGVGVGLILAIMNVFVRDVGQVVPVLMQILYWFTPIVYPITAIPQPYRAWLDYNPLYPIVSACQSALVYNHEPAFGSLVTVSLLGVGLLGFSLFLFRRASGELVDAL